MSSISAIIKDALTKAFRQWEEGGHPVPPTFNPVNIFPEPPPSIQTTQNMMGETASISSPFIDVSGQSMPGIFPTPPLHASTWPSEVTVGQFPTAGARIFSSPFEQENPFAPVPPYEYRQFETDYAMGGDMGGNMGNQSFNPNMF